MSEKLRQIVQQNRLIKHRIRMLANEFQNYQSDLFKELQTLPKVNFDEPLNLNTFIFDLNKLNQSEKIQLAVCGPNNTGKTSFLHDFLDINPILPVSTGPVTARIVRLTFAPADKARLVVYPCIADQETTIVNLNLSLFFSESVKPDWPGIQKEIRVHLERPTDLSEEEFTEWARCFVEIQIPSPVLELGIDVYDTPGFLFYDKQVTKDNLSDLVKLVRPLLVFMYQNSSITDATKECFLALKSTLPDIDRSSIFFLNTQQDVPTIFDGAGISSAQRQLQTPEKFEEILPGERQKRLNLLLKTPLLSTYVHQSQDTENFDIISLPKPRSFLRECAKSMTQSSINHLIQYAIQTDLEQPYGLVTKILDSIDRFFLFFLTTSRRDANQWKKISNDARQWGTRFFNEFEKTMDARIDVVYANIQRYFDQSTPDICDRAAKHNRSNDPLEEKLSQITKNNIQQFIEIAVHEEIIRVAVNEIINETKLSLRISINREISINLDNNDLLLAAQRQVLIDISASELEQRTWLEHFLLNLMMMPRTISRLFRAIRTKLDVEYFNKASLEDFRTKEDYDEYLEILDAHEDLINPDKRREFAESYLLRMRRTIEKQENLFKRNLKDWIQNRRNRFFQNIQENYYFAINNLSARELAYKTTKTFIGQFARLQCHFLALKYLRQFQQHLPIVDTSITLGQGSFFVIHPAQWSQHKNLVIKKLKQTYNDEPNLQYLEAYYHRKITKLSIPNVAPLLFLYINPKDETDLWIFMHRYRQSLFDYLQTNIQTIKRTDVLKISLDIANAISKLHSYEIVHRDIKSKNILMDENNQCFIADFGTCKQSALNSTIVGTCPLPPEFMIARQNSEFIYDGMAVDVFAFGIVLFELIPKLEYQRPHFSKSEINFKDLFRNIGQFSADNREYESLIETCLAKKSDQRPKANKVVEKLEEIQQKFEQKFCMICETQARQCRYDPCGHKLLCSDCHNDFKRNENNEIECIRCRTVVQSWEEDNINDTFLLKTNNKK